MTLGIVVVAHESHGILDGLLADLAQHEERAKVVVVDDRSPSGPPAVPADVDLLSTPTNVGYATACNLGWRHLQSLGCDVVAFLNPDVRLTGPSLTQLAEALLERGSTGLATGPIVDGTGERVSSAWGPASSLRAFAFAAGLDLRRVRRLLGRVATRGLATSGASVGRDDILVDGHVLGGAMVASVTCLEAVDGFDEGFFLYWEDADLCHRVREARWEVRVLPCTPIVHRAGTSSAGVTDEQRWAWYLEGARRFAERHLTPSQARRLARALTWGRRLRGSSSRLP